MTSKETVTISAETTEEYRRAEEFFNSPRFHLHPVKKDTVADSSRSG
jgi:hypothetical protein